MDPVAPQWSPRPMPTPWAGADICSRLLGIPIHANKYRGTVATRASLTLSYFNDARLGKTVLTLADNAVSCWLGGLLTYIPRSVIKENISAGPQPPVLQNYGEVMNVFSRLLNYPNSSRAQWSHVEYQPQGLNKDLTELITKATSRVCWQLGDHQQTWGLFEIVDLG